MAPYGEPKYVDLIYEHLVDIKQDGSYRLNMAYFNYATGLTMTNSRFHDLFFGEPRKPETDISQKEMDLARSIQAVTEDLMIRIAREVRQRTDEDFLCLAGGVALNCVANGRLLREGLFEDIWIQPAAGDAGGAVGAALLVWHDYLARERAVSKTYNTCLGPSYDHAEIVAYLDSAGAVYTDMGQEEMLKAAARLLSEQNVVGWFQGRMEFGPRALGARSILGDPRNPEMQSTMNLKIKYRESFRPFAPSVKAEKAADWFELDRESPYMLLVASIRQDKTIEPEESRQSLFGIDRLNVLRSAIPAVTHVDCSARVQTVNKDDRDRYWALLDAFEQLTGCPVLINTSFNVRGEPIVCSPEDAYRCFMRTEMDYLIMDTIILAKKDQPEWRTDDRWRQEFLLD